MASTLLACAAAMLGADAAAGEWEVVEPPPVFSEGWDAGFAASEAWITSDDGAVDRLRIVANGRGPRGAPRLIGRWDGPAFDPDPVEVSFARGWPLRLTNGRYDLEVTPHAGVGLGDAGGSAEAGATLRLGEAARRLGIRDGAAFGDVGRWYLYAAASGRAVGYNFLRDEDGWTRSGLSTDEGAFIGDTQAGIAWRRGALQASFGYIHREIKPRDVRGAGGGRDDSVVAFSLSIKPRR